MKAMSRRLVLARTFAGLAAAFALGSAGLAIAPVAAAQTFKFANQGDALSMDPHSLNESFQLSFLGNIYEPLVGRGKKLELVPALATLEADRADRLALQSAQERALSRRHAVHRR
jgi:ABC-type transport system substrate-binding protein